jgi:hypothetical protein
MAAIWISIQAIAAQPHVPSPDFPQKGCHLGLPAPSNGRLYRFFGNLNVH